MDTGGDRISRYLEIPQLYPAWKQYYRRVLLGGRDKQLPAGGTGTKMIHIGKNSKSTIISKGISAGHGQNSFRSLVKVIKTADKVRNFTQCDSLLMGDKCGAHTFPYIEVENESAIIEHEATTSKIGEDQIFYCNQRGIDTENAIGLIINGYAREVLNKLPMEFAVEAQKLLQISLEGSVGRDEGQGTRDKEFCSSLRLSVFARKNNNN